MLIVLTLLEIIGRLTLVAALVAVPRSGVAAVSIAMASAVSTALRATLRGRVDARELRRAWDELLAGVRGQSLESLALKREDPDGLVTIVNSVREIAVLRGTLVPAAVGQAVTLATVAAFALVRLPAGWLLAAGACALPLVVAMRFSQRAQRREELRAFDAFVLVERDVRALFEGALELRAHAAEEPVVETVRAGAAQIASHHQRAQTLSAYFALLPGAVALFVAAVPRSWIEALAERSGWLDVGIIGGAGITLTMGLAGTLDAVSRSAPMRAAFRRIASKQAVDVAPHDASAASGEPIETVELAEVCLRYPSETSDTPHRLDLRLSRGGTVLSGPNGSGKSSATLIALGFLDASSGEVRINGAALAVSDLRWLRSRVAYLPQRNFVMPSESLAWHAALGGVVDLVRLREACEQMGLAPRLGPTGDDFSKRLGTLSGGERQRFLIARALARNADWLILDEPEVGLDARGRETLRAVLELEAASRIVLLIAHDSVVAPASFTPAVCTRGPGEGTTLTPFRRRDDVPKGSHATLID